MNNSTDIIIAGAGASGLMAAYAAAIGNKSVLLLEKLPEPGRRILATGGGRCNISNTKPKREWPQLFGAANQFVKPTFERFFSNELTRFFETNGCPCVEIKGFFYPATQRASDIRDTLMDVCLKKGIELKLNSTIEKILHSNNRITGVIINNEHYECTKLIIATGGKSYASLGGSDQGYALAKSVGHKIIDPVPALTPIVTKELWSKSLSGLNLDNASLRIAHQSYRKSFFTGSLLFTHTGLSGPVALNISSSLSRHLLESDTMPLLLYPIGNEVRYESLKESFTKWHDKSGSKQIKSCISQIIPERMAITVCNLSKVSPDTRAGELRKTEIESLINSICQGIPITAVSVGDFEKAMVTSGGIAIPEVNSISLESKIIQGLYFCGEVLNVDGPCGGFNLQWAFSSGFSAGIASSTTL